MPITRMFALKGRLIILFITRIKFPGVILIIMSATISLVEENIRRFFKDAIKSTTKNV